MEKIKIAIVDDHEIFRNGLKFSLSKIDNVEVVVESENGQEFLDVLGEGKAIDLVFMDISMPVLDGIKATEKAMELNPKLKIIALSFFDKYEYVNRMLFAGVEGYMLKNSKKNDFAEAINKVMDGGSYFSQAIIANLSDNLKKFKEKEKEETDVSDIEPLSDREKEVLKLICQGYTAKEIGNILKISHRTVEGHKANIISKTNTKNTVNLVIYAFKNQLVEI